MLSPVRLLNLLAATEPVTVKSATYDDRLSLDLYVPASRGGPLPVAVFFYGGGWDSGERAMYRFVGAALSARGMLVAIPDYRVFPEVRFPGFLEDAARAVRWARDSAGAFGGDPGRLVLVGHSAGAHIAAMLALDRQWLGAVGLDPDLTLRGLVGLAGPYDFLPLHSEHLKDILTTGAGLAATQPINFVDRPVVPTFLAAGTRDRVVDPANSARLAARIEQHGGVSRLRFYERIGHEALIGAFARPLRWLAPVLADTAAFVAQVTE